MKTYVKPRSAAITAVDKKSVYIMISQTQTKFACLIRKFGHIQFNHAAISLDSDLENLYAFARPQHNCVLLGHLVCENVFRYTLGKAGPVPVVIFKLDVSPEEYQWIDETIKRIHDDDKYIYNLLSVLTYPIFKGVRTYKAFTCIEFIMFILQGIGYKLPLSLTAYKPDDLLEILSQSEFFEGNLLDYKQTFESDETYFAHFTAAQFFCSIIAIKELFIRCVFRRRYGP